jgi:hypothetical protein
MLYRPAGAAEQRQERRAETDRENHDEDNMMRTRLSTGQFIRRTVGVWTGRAHNWKWNGVALVTRRGGMAAAATKKKLCGLGATT